MKRKAFSIFLASALIISLFPGTALAKKGDMEAKSAGTIDLSEKTAAFYKGTTTVEDFDYDLTVSFTYDGTQISNLDYEAPDAGSNASYMEDAFSGLKDKITASTEKSFAVDAVSGATLSSEAIVNAINAATVSESSEVKDYSNLTVTSWSEFANALARVTEGGTITIANDIVLTEADNLDTVSSATVQQIGACSKTVTIEGNGHTISCEAGSNGFCFDITGDVTMKNLTIDGGSYSVKCGGAIYVDGAGNTLTLENVTMKNCSAGSSGDGMGGGAIYLEAGSTGGKESTSVATNLIAKNCTFENNVAGSVTDGVVDSKTFGGAIYAWNSNITVENCTFTGNKAYEGGAIAATGDASVTITGCTFDGNSAANSANVGDDVIYYDGTAYFKHGTSNASGSLTLNGRVQGDITLARYYDSADNTPVAVAGKGVNDLIFGDVDHTISVSTALEQAIANAETITDSSLYTSDSWAAFADALTAAKAFGEVSDSTTTDEATLNTLAQASAAAVTLTDAQDGLVTVVTLEQLKTLTDAINEKIVYFGEENSWFPNRQGSEEASDAMKEHVATAQALIDAASTDSDAISNAYYDLYTDLQTQYIVDPATSESPVLSDFTGETSGDSEKPDDGDKPGSSDNQNDENKPGSSDNQNDENKPGSSDNQNDENNSGSSDNQNDEYVPGSSDNLDDENNSNGTNTNNSSGTANTNNNASTRQNTNTTASVSPKTGDVSPVGILFVALAGGAVIFVYGLKRKFAK